MSALSVALESLLEGTVTEETLSFGQGEYDMVARVHETGEILEERYDGEGITLRVRMNRTRLEQLKKSLSIKRKGGARQG
jgi:50S ribosomal subunit-associated GTPase HflX